MTASSAAVPNGSPGEPGEVRSGVNFDSALRRHLGAPLNRCAVTTVQVNLGRLCNQACQHCHVDAGPDRTEVMTPNAASRLIRLLRASRRVEVVDLTGGAPELNPSFRKLVLEARRCGCRVIDRCNLTVLLEPGMEDLAQFLADQGVVIAASLPCYGADNVDRQRGRGVFEKSIRALRRLNRLGYGRAGSGLELDLVYNPAGAFLPPPQEELEQQYRSRLRASFGIEFDHLLTMTNMPIRRFRTQLDRKGQYHEYLDLLVRRFNPRALDGLMCRSLVSVGHDGRLYDCDFNQMLDISLETAGGEGALTIWEIDGFEELDGGSIATAIHCYGCTAGAGSSCGGALD
jgi:radical SAM/Cys-rich protein